MPKPRFKVEELCNGHWTLVVGRLFVSRDAAQAVADALCRGRSRVMPLSRTTRNADKRRGR